MFNIWTRLAGCILFTLFVTCCATPPTPRELTREEVIQREVTLSTAITRRITQSSKLIHDIEATVYLRRIAERLAKANDETRDRPIGVFLIKNPDQSWRSFGVPGNKLYMSLGLIQTLNSDSALAAAMALELGHLAQHHLSKRDSIPTEAIEFTPQEIQDSLNEGVRLLYFSGYDPRGMLQYLDTLGANPKTSPYSEAVVQSLREIATRAVVRLTPLRNPIVRTDAFLGFQKRIKKL